MTPRELIIAGWHAEVEPMLFTARIIITDGAVVEFLWCFHTYEAAKIALRGWRMRAYEGEPDGWHRARRPGEPFRRRPDGDQDKEYVDNKAALP